MLKVNLSNMQDTLNVINGILSYPCLSSFFLLPFGRLMGVLVPKVGGIKMNENLCHVDDGM